jgi:post-segregation antitoxin (ccd killing protein)
LGASSTRRTVTISSEVETAIDALVGPGKFSAFVQRALAHELQRESIAQWLEEREAARGGRPLSPEAVEFAEAAWRKRK